MLVLSKSKPALRYYHNLLPGRHMHLKRRSDDLLDETVRIRVGRIPRVDSYV